MEDLEEKEKEWKEAQRREKEQQALMNCENLLPNHTASFFGPQQKSENKIQRLERFQQRMRRCRSMPKMTQEEVRCKESFRCAPLRTNLHSCSADVILMLCM